MHIGIQKWDERVIQSGERLCPGGLWLFGGPLASSTEENYFKDLWKFDPATSERVWISGSSTVGSNCLVISTNKPLRP
jgi:hypothetical protein